MKYNEQPYLSRMHPKWKKLSKIAITYHSANSRIDGSHNYEIPRTVIYYLEQFTGAVKQI